jgi:surfactin synthase thioesterase subunit
MGNKISFSPGFTKEDYRHLLANGVPIEGRRVGPASLFIEIQSGRPGKSPLFLIGPFHLKFINSIALDHPTYCTPATWFLLSNPKRYISDIAAVLAREILSIEPDGPFLLVGQCFDGWISYEIARILTASKKNVDLLFLIDVRAPHRCLRSSVRPIKHILARMCTSFSRIKKTADTSAGRSLMESDNHLEEARSSILVSRTAAANSYKNGRHRYDGYIDVLLSDNGSGIKKILDKMDWNGFIRGKSRITFVLGSDNWANQMQLDKLRQMFSICLVDAQNMAERRKSGH